METLTVTCPHCGAANPADLKFCQECWALLHGRPCPGCGRPATRVGALTCAYCGESLYAFGSRSADRGPTAPGPAGAPGVCAEPGRVPVRGGGTAEAVRDPVRQTDAAAPTGAPVQEAAVAEANGETGGAAGRAGVLGSGLELCEGADVTTSGPGSRGAAAAVRSRPAWPHDVAVATLVVAALAGLFVVRGALRGGAADRAAPAAASPPAARAPAATPAPAVPSVPAAPAAATSARAAPATATVSIHTTPAGARVEFDGRPVGTGSLTLEGVPPGAYTLRVSKAGFRQTVRELRVDAGDRVVVHVALSPAPPRRRPPPPPPPPPQ